MEKVDKDTRRKVVYDEFFLDKVIDFPNQLTSSEKERMIKTFPSVLKENGSIDYYELACKIADYGGVVEFKKLLNEPEKDTLSEMADEDDEIGAEVSTSAEEKTVEGEFSAEESVSDGLDDLVETPAVDSDFDKGEDVMESEDLISEDGKKVETESDSMAVSPDKDEEAKEVEVAEPVEDEKEEIESSDPEAEFLAQFSSEAQKYISDHGVKKEVLEELIDKNGLEIVELAIRKNIADERKKEMADAKKKKVKVKASESSEEPND